MLASKEKVHDLVAFTQEWELLNRFLKLELSRDDLSEIKQNKKFFLQPDRFTAKLTGLLKKYPSVSVPFGAGPDFSGVVNHAWEFYGLAEKRDAVLAEKAAAGLEGFHKGILVTGGFHTEGIQKILEKSGVSYTTWSPKITAELDPHKYEAIMLNNSYDFVEFSETRLP